MNGIDMTPEPTEAQIKEACEKANALIRTIVPLNVLTKISVDPKTSYIDDAFVRLVMEHEAFRQRVSEIAKIAENNLLGMGMKDTNETIRRLRSLILPDPTPTPEQVLAEAAPIPMILHCPECGGRHIDEGVFADKPHHTHACQHCGMVWRPAKVDTCGVQFLPGYSNVAPIKDTRYD